MKFFLSLTHNTKPYRVSASFDAPTSGDFFKLLFINRAIWDHDLSMTVIKNNGETENIGTLDELFSMPLIQLCTIASRYYGSNRLRAVPRNWTHNKDAHLIHLSRGVE